MGKIASVIKRYYFVVVFAAFAVFSARALHYSSFSCDDWLFAVKADGGFFGAVAYGARELGEGIVGSFFRTALTAAPTVIWKIVCSAALVFSAVSVGLIACRFASAGAEDESKDAHEAKVAASITFSCAAFMLIPLAVLREAVFSIAGTVHFAVPAALIFALYLALDSAAKGKKGAWKTPLLAFCAALLSWQAAIAAIIFALWFVVRSAKTRPFRLSFAVALAAPVAVLIAHVILWNVPRFPDVSRLFAIRSFLGEAFGDGGFSAVLAALSILVCARVLAERVIPALRSSDKPPILFIFHFLLALAAAFNAIVMFVRSPLLPGVELSGSLTVSMNAITLALLCADYVLELREKKDGGALFALAALVSAAVTLPTYTFGGAGFYLPIALICVVLACEFLRARKLRGATVVLGAVGAYYAASLCLSGGKAIIAAAFALVLAILEFSPVLRRVKAVEALAVVLAAATLLGIGGTFAAVSDVAAENEKRIEEYKKAPSTVLILRAEAAPDADSLAYYRQYYGIGDGVQVYFTDGSGSVPDDLGDINGDGVINSRDRMLFLKMLGE